MSSQFTPPPGGLAESTGNPRTDLSEDETIAVTIVVALVVLSLILLLIGGALAL